MTILEERVGDDQAIHIRVRSQDRAGPIAREK